MNHFLSNGTYFEEFPTHILGEVYDTTDRFGKPIKAVRGNMEDVVMGISVAPVHRYDHFKEGQKITSDEQDKIKRTLAKTKSENSAKTKRKNRCREGLQCLSDTIQKYNPGISEEEMKVWVTYQVNRGLFNKETILQNDWSKYYVEENDFLQTHLGKLTAYDGDNYIPNVLYYSGNIYQKIKDLKSKSEIIIEVIGKEAFDSQLSNLEAIKPPLLHLTDGEESKLTLSPFDKIFRDFRITVLADGTEFSEPTDLIEIFSWNYLGILTTDDFILDKQKTSAYDIRNHWLKRTRFSRGTPDSEKAARKRAAQTIGTLLFDRFLFETLTREDRLRLEYLWNSRHNNYVEVNWNKIPVGFEINEHFKGGKLQIRPAQREGVAFLNINGTGIIAYDVGVGKTMTAILYLADMISKGLCKRPLVVVPNPTYEKWLGEIHGVFAKKDIRNKSRKLLFKKGELISEGILPQYPINDYYNLGAGHLSKAVDEKGFTLSVEDYSITVVTYEGLSKIGFREESESKLIGSIKAILSQGETGRDAAIIEEQIAALVDKSLDKSELYIEDMGIDAIVVDEAHNFKNLFTQVRGEAIQGEYGDVERQTNHYELKGKQPSSRAIKLFMLNRYIHLHYNRRNTIGLTATPFTNSPLEIYSMQALFDYDGLKEHGIENIVDYFNSFIDETYEAVWTSRGQFEQRAVIRGFNNLPTMQAIIFKYILYKTGEEANISRPEKVVLPLKNDEQGLPLPIEYQAGTEIPATEEQKTWFKEIANFARQKYSELNIHYPTDYRGLVPGRDLIAINAAQLATFSPLLLPWREIDESTISAEAFLASSPKMHYVVQCIQSVKNYHEDRKEEVSGQVIYSNRGTKFFPHIKEYLVEKIGYKEPEVQIITGGISSKKKEKIKADFLDGKVKVIIGSATIREGIDLQKRSTVLYNCYLDWNPTDIKQLEGRIWRFGNIYSHVRIVVPLIENSFDIFLNQKLGEKTSRVNNIWSRNGRKTVLKLEELNPDELKKGLITDPEELVKMEIEEQTQELSIQRDLLKGYIKQLGEASSEKLEVDRLVRKLQLVAERANEAWSYSSIIDPKVIDQITKIPIDNIKGIYRKVKAYADTRDWSEKYDLKRTVDEHIKKLKKLERTEKNILSKNDLSINDDFQSLILNYENKVVQISDSIKLIKSESNRQSLLQEFIEEREKKNLESKTLKERVQEFERLNFLLECSDTPINKGNTCTIYGINRGEGEQVIQKYEKADWEISQNDFLERKRKEYSTQTNPESNIEDTWKQTHQLSIAKAIERGEKIPKAVLDKYPNIIPEKLRKEVTALEEYQMSATLKKFIPTHQQKSVQKWNPELQLQVLKPLDTQIQAIPKSQAKRSFEELEVYAHFFYAGSDWFITEWDRKDYLFGYAILGGDVQMSELGSMFLSEFKNNGKVELDFYWKPIKLTEALHQAHPSYFKKPKQEPIQIKEKQAPKLKLAKAKMLAQKQRIRILELEQLAA